MRKKTDPGTVLRKASPIIILLIIFASALWLRSFPARFNEIQALDPFFFYRIGLELMQNNWHLGVDMLRYHPAGIDTIQYHYLMPIYLPAFVYTLLTAIGFKIHYLNFAIMWPAVLGAIAVIPMYLLGREIFGKKAGLFAAFFLATVPAFITRTSAGFFEKEPIAGVFIVSSAYFFVRALKRGSWIYGTLAGSSLAITSLAWGGVQYVYMLFDGFLAMVFVANLLIVLLDYLFGGFNDILDTLKKYMGMDMIKAFMPTILLGTLVQQLFARHIALTNVSIVASFVLLGMLLIRHGVERFKLVRSEYMPYVVPSMLIILVSGSLVGAMSSDSVANNIRQITELLTFRKSVIGTTVAENAPGNWNNIISTTGTGYITAVSPQLASVAPYLSLWILMFLGAGLLVYRFFRTREWIMLLPVIWLLSAIVGVFYFVRLVFLIGPPASLSGGIFIAWVVERLGRVKALRRDVRYLSTSLFRTKLHHIIAAAIVILVVAVNMSSAYAYSLNIGPSICFPRYRSGNPFDVEPCITIDENGNEVMSPNQPWYEAFDFLANKTPENSSVLSWWDFGYWFQYRGKRPTIADGGHTGGKYMRTDKNIAEWFVDNSDNWDSYKDWFLERDVDYILMDYTLPGKYGAISKIASDGEQVVGMIQFSQRGVEPRGNDTIYIFKNGQYEIWLPLDTSGTLTGTPMFLVTKNGQYFQKSYINDVCTKSGVVKAGNHDPAIPGCITISDLGVYYIPPEAEHSIFVNLMFMDGAGLPVKKVFDNKLIKIYEVDYDNWD